MKKRLCFLLVLLLLPLNAKAIESTAYTYTLMDEYNRFIRTQDAYMPGSVILRELGLKSPEDLCLNGRTLYIADTGNGRIVRYDMEKGYVEEIGKGVLQQPTGICVWNHRLYAADYRAQAVVIFDEYGHEIQRILRPDDLIYGINTAYKPQKVAVDAFGNLFVTSEGTHEGILQFDAKGHFSGFFSANRANSLSLTERITDALFTQEQKDKQARRNPKRVVNLDISSENLVYSLTQQSPSDAVKMLNMAGINVSNARYLFADANVVDLAVAPDGVFYTVTDMGNIVEYDSDGLMLFAFGGRAVSSDRNGLTSVVSALCVDEQHNLYILDKQRGVVQPYAATDFSARIHDGLALYNSGKYREAASIWQDNIRLSPTARFAHAGYGKALWQMGEYQAAFSQLVLGNEMEYASEAYWEMRNNWLMANLSKVFIVLLGFALLFIIRNLLQKKTQCFNGIHKWARTHLGHMALCRVLRSMRNTIAHPLDTLYDLKHRTQGSLSSALALFFLALLIFILDVKYSAPLFNSGALTSPGASPLLLIGMVALPAALFVTGNYFIASINDGEGSMRGVVTAMGYALSFYIICTPLTTVLTYALTYNEQFILTLLKVVIYGYTIVLIYLAAKETHNYSFWQTIKNLALTVCFVALALLAIAILYMLWHELFSFIETLIEEVRLRA